MLGEVERLWTLADPLIASKLWLLEARRRTVDEHADIIDALRRRDRDECVAALDRHRAGRGRRCCLTASWRSRRARPDQHQPAAAAPDVETRENNIDRQYRMQYCSLSTRGRGRAVAAPTRCRRKGYRVAARSIEVAGLHHGGAPIPAAATVRGLVMSSGIIGMDRTTGEIAENLDDQVSLLFDNIETIVVAAGGAVRDIVKVTFFVTDRSSREAINAGWRRMFPDESDRPARHTLTYELPSPMLVQAEVVAMVGAS